MIRHPLAPCAAVLALFLAGCANEAPPTADATQGAAAAMEMQMAADAAATELSAEDQALVATQKICPVGGSDLGSMGTPVKVMVGERAVFVCCEHCREPLLKDPEKYLAKLDNPEPAPETPAAPAGDQPASEAPKEGAAPAAEAPASS